MIGSRINMTDKEFMELYPDTDNKVLCEALAISIPTLMKRASTLNIKKSKMFYSIRSRKCAALSGMRGDLLWEPEYNELKSLAVCMENYKRITDICDMFFTRNITGDRLGKEYTESQIRRLLEDNKKRFLQVDSLSQEAKTLLEEQKSLLAKLYSLQRAEDRNDAPFTDYVIYK